MYFLRPIKRNFDKGERIELYFGGSFEHKEVKYELLNNKGETIKKDTLNGSKKEWFGPFTDWNKVAGSFYKTYELVSIILNETENSSTDKLKPGNYRTFLYTDGNLETTWDFKIIGDQSEILKSQERKDSQLESKIDYKKTSKKERYLDTELEFPIQNNY